jgi:hypothetical protein
LAEFVSSAEAGQVKKVWPLGTGTCWTMHEPLGLGAIENGETDNAV